MRILTILMALAFLPVQTFAADPIPNTPTIVTPQPEFPKGPQYAAIAVSPKTLDYGTAQNMTSQAEAEAEAKRKCSAHSKAMDCQVAVHFYDACGAVAIKRQGDISLGLGTGSDRGGAYGADWAASQSSAERKAQRTCENTAPSGCMVVKSFCSQ